MAAITVPFSALADSTTIGPAWIPQGPGPIRGGQVSNIFPDNDGDGGPDDEVVGAIHTVLAHPADADILYLGAVNGGIWRTTNATAPSPNWTPLTDNLPSPSIGAMEFDPTDPTSNTIIAAIGRFSAFGGEGGLLTGLLLTTDGGSSFTELDDPLLIGRNFSGVAKRGNIILAASNNFNGGTNENSGVYRSLDTGMTWRFISGTGGLAIGAAFDLVGDPNRPSRFYVSIQKQGIFRSEDSGATWINVSSGDASLNMAITSSDNNNTEMAVSPVDGRLYVAVLRSSQLNYIGFTDDGVTWTAMDVVDVNFGQGAIHFSIVADPFDNNIVYIGGDAGVAEDHLQRGDASAPAGAQWESLIGPQSLVDGGGTANSSTPHVDSREMVFDANGHIIEVDDGGIYRRTSPRDNTGDWFSINGDVMVTEQHDIAYDTVSNIIISGTQDNGTVEQLDPGSTTWAHVSGGDGGDVAVAVDDPVVGQSTRYSSSQHLGSFRRRIFDAANNLIATQFPSLTPLPGSSHLGGMDTAQFVTPVIINAVAPERLLFAGGNRASGGDFGNVLFESLDRGDTIRQIDTITDDDDGDGRPDTIIGFGILGKPLAYGGMLNGVPNPDVVYAGTFNRGTNANTVRVRSAPFPAAFNPTPEPFPGGFIADLVLDSDDWRTAFVIDRNNVFMTTNAGATWTNITGNLGMINNTLVCIEFIPSPGVDAIVVGGNGGVSRMPLDTPGTWQPFGTDFGNAPVWDMVYDPEDDVLIAGTLGRGAWRLSPVASIFNITHLVGDKDQFQPNDMVDVPPRSSRVEDILTLIEADPGQGPGVDLDVGGVDRPVGLTHFFTLPDQARITSATITFRIRGESALVDNDFVIYDESVEEAVSVGFLPVIALRDLLGREPQEGEIHALELNLGKAPVRTEDTAGGPAGNWSPTPEAFRNLLPQLFDGQFDMVLSDDVAVDFSELSLTFVFSDTALGDLNGDEAVDRTDIDIMIGSLNTNAYLDDPRDLDGDGLITALDARILVNLCTRPRCATE